MRYTQENIERQIADIVPHGTREAIAAETGIYGGVIRGWFNPDDERKSPYFTVLHIQAALDKINPEAGERLWQLISSLREASSPAVAESVCMDVEEEMGKTAKEVADVISARCQHLPIPEQLREIKEARKQIDRYEQAVKAEVKQKVKDRFERLRAA